MSINCENYEDCPRQLFYTSIITGENQFDFLFVGCWGVYCKAGEYASAKYKNNKWKDSKITYGEGYVVKEMIDFVNSSKNKQQAVVIAGDNVYSDYPSDRMKELIATNQVNKDALFDIDKQLAEGFTQCMKQIPVDTFLIGLGNHDIESCYILNKQLNFTGWTMPAISYNIVYKQDDFNVNLIFIDTNMYEKEWCQGIYPDNAVENQSDWVGKVLNEQEPNTWNIVIGHIPFICNPHKVKEGKAPKARVVLDLVKLMSTYHNQIDLYMCADEHNQQYITLDGMPPQVVSGSGGASLDREVYVVVENTQLVRPIFGFVSVDVNIDTITLTFHTASEQSKDLSDIKIYNWPDEELRNIFVSKSFSINRKR